MTINQTDMAIATPAAVTRSVHLGWKGSGRSRAVALKWLAMHRLRYRNHRSVNRSGTGRLLPQTTTETVAVSGRVADMTNSAGGFKHPTQFNTSDVAVIRVLEEAVEVLDEGIP
jgi:hypothetical protein